MNFTNQDTLKMNSEKGDFHMDNTHEFVEKLHERQEKAKKNEERQGKKHASEKLPNKQH